MGLIGDYETIKSVRKVSCVAVGVIHEFVWGAEFDNGEVFVGITNLETEIENLI